ncbi:MAG: hypothetical protein JRG91_16270, partial [Deltaproteobacteria bacterium]|nr:hypothetical protein [Deltaproteobacteria bacterium]
MGLKIHLAAGALGAALTLLSPPAAADDPVCCPTGAQKECQDGWWCNGDEVCNCWGDCESGYRRCHLDPPDPCIDITCVEEGAGVAGSYGAGHCEVEYVCEDECDVDGNCSPIDVCHYARCESHRCVDYAYPEHPGDPECCMGMGDCASLVTRPSCQTWACEMWDESTVGLTDVPYPTCHMLSDIALPDCCEDSEEDAACDAAVGGAVCETGYCPADGAACLTSWIPNCCEGDVDCVVTDVDGYICTTRICDVPANACIDGPDAFVYDDCASANLISGSGPLWLDEGDTFCGSDLYTPAGSLPSSCRAAETNDNFHTFRVEADYQLHAYKISAWAPHSASGIGWREFDPMVCLHYPYEQEPLVPGTDADGICGVSTPLDTAHALDWERVLLCNNTNTTIGGTEYCPVGATYDNVRDACIGEYPWELRDPTEPIPYGEPVLPDGYYNSVVDTGPLTPAGGPYRLQLEQTREVDNLYCGGSAPDIEEPVQIQMGGVWTGNTELYTALKGVGFCTARELQVQGSTGAAEGQCVTVNMPSGCGTCSWTGSQTFCMVREYGRAEFMIDHRSAQWNRDMGYVISTETGGGVETAMSLAGGGCGKDCECPGLISGCSGAQATGCPVACDHASNVAGGGGSRLVSGIIPAGKLASLSLHGYYSSIDPEIHEGNYSLKVQYDRDGDGLPDHEDGFNSAGDSSHKWGQRRNGTLGRDGP